MKVKISENAVTFKITEDEMRQLLADHSLERKILIGQNHLCMVVYLNAHEDSEEAPFRLISDPSKACLSICVTQEEIQRLADMGKDRRGILVKSGDLEAILQVDVRSDSRPRRN